MNSNEKAQLSDVITNQTKMNVTIIGGFDFVIKSLQDLMKEQEEIKSMMKKQDEMFAAMMKKQDETFAAMMKRQDETQKQINEQGQILNEIQQLKGKIKELL